jgi:hypothetical protein
MDTAKSFPEGEAMANYLVPHRVIEVKKKKEGAAEAQMASALFGRSALRGPLTEKIQVLAMPIYVTSLDCWHGKLTLDIAWKMGTQIRQALDYLASKRLTHCDVKPSNIFVSMVSCVLSEA